MDIILPDELEDRFRVEVAKQKGMRRGNLTLAVQEAIRLWIESQQEERSTKAKKAWETRKAKSQSSQKRERLVGKTE